MFRTLQLLVAASFVMGYPPAPVAPADGTSRSDGPAAPVDDCCEHAAPTSGNEKPAERDCCPDGCQGCALPCCGGSAALTGTSVAGLTTPGAAALAPPTSATHLPGSDQREIDHPPRI